MLLALLIAAAPPARVVVPDSLKKEREAEAAQKPPELPLFADPRIAEALGRFVPQAGAWAEYAVLPKKGPQARLKLSVLQTLEGGRYWLEAQTQKQGGPPVAMKMLLHGPPGPVENLERLYVFIEGLAPMEFPLQDVKSENAAKPLPKIERKADQDVKLRIGTFRCEVFEVQGARVFRSAKVPLFGLVRALDKARRVELVAYGDKGAESVFPREFDQGSGSESTK